MKEKDIDRMLDGPQAKVSLLNFTGMSEIEILNYLKTLEGENDPKGDYQATKKEAEGTLQQKISGLDHLDYELLEQELKDWYEENKD